MPLFFRLLRTFRFDIFKKIKLSFFLFNLFSSSKGMSSMTYGFFLFFSKNFLRFCLTYGWTILDIFFIFFLLIIFFISDFDIGKLKICFGNFLFNFLKHCLFLLYIFFTSASALNIGKLKYLLIKVFPEAISPIKPILIIV